MIMRLPLRVLVDEPSGAYLSLVTDFTSRLTR
jgi:hypothetical protein